MRLSKKRVIAAIIGLILLTTVFAWWKKRPDAVVVRMRQKQSELFAASGTTPADQQKKWREFRDEMKKLTPDQRKGVRAGFGKTMDQRMMAYLKAPPDERKKTLDQDIARMESMRQRFDQGKDKKGGNRPPGANNARGKDSKSRSPEQTERRNKDRLDKSTPEQRAARDLYFKEMTDRRKQLGLPAGRGPSRRGRV